MTVAALTTPKTTRIVPRPTTRTEREDLARWEEEGGKVARVSAEPKGSQPHALVVNDDDDGCEAIVATPQEAGCRHGR